MKLFSLTTFPFTPWHCWKGLHATLYELYEVYLLSACYYAAFFFSSFLTFPNSELHTSCLSPSRSLWMPALCPSPDLYQLQLLLLNALILSEGTRTVGLLGPTYQKRLKGKEKKLKSQTATITQFTVSHRGKQQSAKKEMLDQDSIIHLKQIKTLYFTHLRLKERAYCGDTPRSACFSRNPPPSVAHFFPQAPH